MWSKRGLAARALEHTGLGSLLRQVGAWRGLLVLCYHRIADRPEEVLDRGVWSATTAVLEEQIRVLKRVCDVIAPDDLPTALERRAGRLALLTFDDGYRDAYTMAFPVLRAQGVRALFFLITGVLDEPRAMCWDEIAWMVRRSAKTRVPPGPDVPEPVVFDEPERERAIASLMRCRRGEPSRGCEIYLEYLAGATGSGRIPREQCADLWLTWDQVREMRAAGMAFGGHTHQHLMLCNLSPAHCREELSACAATLQRELGEPMTTFSYPFGTPEGCGSTARACLTEVGVRYAFSQCGGYLPAGRCDPLDIPRMAVERWMGPVRFRASLTVPRYFATA